jgi:hypothetical protein
MNRITTIECAPRPGRRLFLAVGLLLASAVAHAAEPFALGGHLLGERFERVLDDPAFDCDSASACFLYAACVYRGDRPRALADIPLEDFMLYFTGERLSGASGSFETGYFDAVLHALESRYGPALAESANGSNTVLVWRQRNQLLRLERHARPGRSSVILAERNFLSELLGD